MKTLILAAVVLLLGGCAALGLQKPQSFDEQLANAYGIHTAILTSLTNVVGLGLMSAAEGKEINQQAENARFILDAARTAEQGGDLTTAAQKLSVALQALTTIQTDLSAKPPATASAGGS